MATWLILVLAALVLAVIGATTTAMWLLVAGLLLLVAGGVWALVDRRGRTRPLGVRRAPGRSGG